MSLINIDKLNVTAVYVTDLQESVEFYIKTLGFEKKREMLPGVLLYHQIANLTLYVEPGRQARDQANRHAPHTALCFNAQEGVKQALEALEKSGVPILQKYGDFESEFAGFCFTDPSGNVLEIAGKP